MYAIICVDLKTTILEEKFTYRVPQELEPFIEVGSRVSVPFGNTTRLGYVLALSDSTDFKGEIKDVSFILDFGRSLTDEQIELAYKIQKDTLCSLSMVLETMLPSFLRSTYKQCIQDIQYDVLDPLLTVAFKLEKKVMITEALKDYLPLIKKEEKLGHLTIGSDLKYYGKSYEDNHSIKLYSLNTEKEIDSKISKVRQKVIHYLEANSRSSIENIIAYAQCTPNLIHTMVKDEMIKEERVPLETVKTLQKSFRRYLFNDTDKALFKDFDSNKDHNSTFLLMGNLEDRERFLMHEIEMTINNGHSVVITAPTIVKCFELRKSLMQNTKNVEIAEFSSLLKTSDFYTNYFKAKNGTADIILTTRIGLTLPFNNIGLMICCDEENMNYISEMTPRIDGRSVLRWRSATFNCPLIFASPTPSIETAAHAYKGDYFTLNYPRHIHPSYLIDLNKESDTLITRPLKGAIKEAINHHQKVLLILNTLGYSHSNYCRSCGEIIRCHKCQTPLTFFKDKDELRCPVCGDKSKGLKCPKCKSTDIMPLGCGMEQLVEKLKVEFPGTPVVQMDYTKNSSRLSYEDFLLNLDELDSAIIVGSSMMLDINTPKLACVGIINADDALSYHSYRASEVAYSLMARAVMRPNVDVYIQTYEIGHSAIIDGKNADFSHFFMSELKERQYSHYPPFGILLEVMTKGPYEEMFHSANYLKVALNKSGLGEYLGPNYDRSDKSTHGLIKIPVSGLLNEPVDVIQKVYKLINDVKKKFAESDVNMDINTHVR